MATGFYLGITLGIDIQARDDLEWRNKLLKVLPMIYEVMLKPVDRITLHPGR